MATNYVQLEHLNQLIKDLEFGELHVVITVHEGVVTGMEIKEEKKLKFSVEATGVKLILASSRYHQKPTFDNLEKKTQNIG